MGEREGVWEGVRERGIEGGGEEMCVSVRCEFIFRNCIQTYKIDKQNKYKTGTLYVSG